VGGWVGGAVVAWRQDKASVQLFTFQCVVERQQTTKPTNQL